MSCVPLDDEVQRIHEIRTRALEEINHRGLRNPIELHLRANLGTVEQTIGPLEVPVVPQFLRATCSRASLSQLQILLHEAHAWASGLVGLDFTEASVLYNGDPAAIFLRDEWITWAVAHARERLARHNPRDRHPFAKFFRLFMEVCGWLDKVCLTPGVRIALREVPPRVAAEIWDATVGPEIRVHPAEGEDYIDYGAIGPEWRGHVRFMLQLHGWNQDDALTLAHRQFPSRAAGEPAVLVERRRALAADIVESRALLIPGYDAEAVACSQPGGWTTFEWDTMHGAGLIIVAATREKLSEQEFAGQSLYPVCADLEGRIAGGFRWWKYSDDVAWEVALLEPLHTRLVEMWLARAPSRPPDAEPSTVATAVAVVADACQHIAEPVEGRRVPAVRMQSLLHMLERRFSCEVTAGKGSEVTVYRPGGRKFTLGHHTRNTHVPAHLVRALLKAVGITVTEWWRMCAKA